MRGVPRIPMFKKQTLFTLAKVALALLVLALLFHKNNSQQVWQNVSDAFRTHPLLIVAGTCVCWLTVPVAALRWNQLLAAFGVPVPLRTAVCIVQIGQFFLTFLPGPTGDDLTRMLYVSRLSKDVGQSVTTVLLDRCIGLASILVVATVCVPLQWHALTTSPSPYIPWLAYGIVGAGATVILAILLYFVLDGGWMQHVVERILRLLPASRITTELSKIGRHVFFHKGVIAKVMAIAISTQLILCALFYLAGLAVGIHIPVYAWLGFVPIVLAANALPITPLGAGIRESLVVLFLGVLSPETTGALATAASLIASGMMLVVCLSGGVVYIFYRPAPKQA